MLQLKNLHFSRDKKILDGISLKIPTGHFLGIVGPSGAGKSSLLQIIAGLLDADSGSVSLDGDQIRGPKDRLIPGHPEISLINQDFRLDVYHTVWENLLLQTGHLPEEVRISWCDELLQLVELDALKARKAHELSGGEQQRLALARALASEPKVLLLDEPFAHQDAHIRRKLITYLSALRRIRKTSFILVSHDGAEVLSLADQVAFLENGRISRIDAPEAMYQHPASAFEGQFFGHLNVITVNRKQIYFRPENYRTLPADGDLEIQVRFRKKHFHGFYTLLEYQYKRQVIFLLERPGEMIADNIYLSPSNG